jgi:integrase
MNININLDKFKPLFKAAVNKLDFGIGFSLYVDTKGLTNHKLQASKGLDKGYVFYNSIVKIITNPQPYIKGMDYMCPSNSEYIISLSDYIKGTQLTIMLEKKGMWLFRMADGEQVITLIDQFRGLLESIGLSKNRDGLPYTLYSLRHFYAVEMLRKGKVGVFDIARNMGTSVQIIEQYYGKQATPMALATKLGG